MLSGALRCTRGIGRIVDTRTGPIKYRILSVVRIALSSPLPRSFRSFFRSIAFDASMQMARVERERRRLRRATACDEKKKRKKKTVQLVRSTSAEHVERAERNDVVRSRPEAETFRCLFQRRFQNAAIHKGHRYTAGIDRAFNQHGCLRKLVKPSRIT